METKHTPGPWKAKTHAGRRWVDAAKNQQVCDVSTETSQGDDLKESAANARLIAAAPALLEALNAVLTAMDVAQDRAEGDLFGSHHNKAMDAIDAARDAIALASGP